ncbi:hypothetical protein Sjap_020161 [Stephania japonica]|uniref:Uncharacterized protein n=1 Tax=Stephania japonica TaxID=461633 RepID=A0AAP0F2Z0_9MAGN
MNLSSTPRITWSNSRNLVNTLATVPVDSPFHEGRTRAYHDNASTSSTLEPVRAKLMDATIVKPNLIDLELFDKARLPIRALLETKGYAHFCQHRAKYYPSVVQVFYSNMKTSNDYTIMSLVGSRQVLEDRVPLPRPREDGPSHSAHHASSQ